MTNKLKLPRGIVACAIAFVSVVSFSSCKDQSQSKSSGNIVSNIEEFKQKVPTLQAGDTLILANGEWNDVNFVFEGNGTEEAPIVLMAEEQGKVLIQGASDLRLSGKYLVVKGLVFVNGKTPASSVISFRKNGENLAYNCRVTNCVIDHFNQSDKFDRDVWLELYGKNNRVDHCYFGGKLNVGEVLRVKLNNPENLDNNHLIDHNYFGYRPRLGSNGGETLRIGTAEHSLKPSNTVVENNYFEQCNGEVENISIKSSDNIIRGNTLFECEGVLALRHGDRNLVENNFFIGNKKPHTGGVRVINSGQIIRNNHFQELTGSRFFGTLPIMNGVPNSLINRYHHAKDIKVEGNHFFFCDNIEFCVGSDNERTDVPENIEIANNVFYHTAQSFVFKVLDDISKFSFSNNKSTTSKGALVHKGFVADESTYTVAEATGLFQSDAYAPELIATKENCGPQWYQKIPKYFENISSGRTVEVNNYTELKDAIEKSEDGDTLVLKASEYVFDGSLNLTKKITIKGVDSKSNLTVFKYKTNEKTQPFLVMSDGGSLAIKNILFIGKSEAGVASAAIITQKEPMIEHYNFKAVNCAFVSFNASKISPFRVTQSTYADSVTFESCLFSDISGDAISIAGEQDEKGKYNAEFITIKNCRFENVMGSALNLLRGGNDESTLGPFLVVDHCSFININNKELGSVLLLTGVQRNEIKNCLFQDSGKSGRAIKLEDPYWAESVVHHTSLYKSGRIESYHKRIGESVYFSPNSEITNVKLGDDGKSVGCDDLSGAINAIEI